MTTRSKIALLLGVLAVALVALVGQFVRVRETGIDQARYTANTGELTADTLVGQTFTATEDNLAGIAVMFATYSGRAAAPTLELHVRESISSTADIRQVTVQHAELGDNQMFRFEFEPIANSRDQQYFFFVRAPESVSGTAATVDINTTDPYHLGSAYLARGVDASPDNPQVLVRSGKQTVDVAFTTYHSVPFNRAAVHRAQEFVRDVRFTWQEKRALYWIWVKMAVPPLLFLGLLWQLRRPNDERQLTLAHYRIVLWLLCAVAIGWRLMYANELPVTTDEGNYFYDARTLREGMLAGGDGYVKAPLVIAWMSLWQLIAGDTILGGRLASVVISSLAVFPIFTIGRLLKNKQAGLCAAAVWAFFGAPVVTTMYAHTQPLALFFGLCGIAVLWQAVRGEKIKQFAGTGQTKQTGARWFIIAGILLGLGVASRKSILAVGLVPLVLIMCESVGWRDRFRRVLHVGTGFLAVIAVLLSAAYLIYGWQGVAEAVGLNSAEDGITAVETSQLEQVRAYSLRGMTPFFRESLPLILLSMLGWGFVLESLAVDAIDRFRRGSQSFVSWLVFSYAIPKIAWLLPIGVFWRALGFFFEYEGAPFHIYGIPWLWYLMLAVLVLAAVWPDRLTFAEKKAAAVPNVIVPSAQPKDSRTSNVVGVLGAPLAYLTTNSTHSLAWQLSGALLLPAWLGGLTFFYMNWIKFHANYIGEFLPPLAVYSGAGAYLLWQRFSAAEDGSRVFLPLLKHVALVTVLAVMCWAIFVSNLITFLYEHTGTFQQASAKEAAAWAKEHIPIDEPIFTGAALIPYLSGHHVALDIAHPRWYAYEFVRKDPARLNTFLPPVEDMLNAYREADWFLLEGQTGFSFLMEYSEIEAGLATDWEQVQGIENGSNTLTFYKRR